MFLRCLSCSSRRLKDNLKRLFVHFFFVRRRVFRQDCAIGISWFGSLVLLQFEFSQALLFHLLVLLLLLPKLLAFSFGGSRGGFLLSLLPLQDLCDGALVGMWMLGKQHQAFLFLVHV